jgi:hypothetical protein
MTASPTGGGARAARALWRRSALWRFSVCAGGVLILLSLIYPPRWRTPPPVAPPAPINGATFKPSTAPPVANATAPPLAKPVANEVPAAQPAAKPAVPKTAKLSLATPAGPPAPVNLSGLDPALLGRTYHGTLGINGFNVLLPQGEWALLANQNVRSKQHSENTGVTYLLGRIEQKRLVGAIRVTGMRSPSLPGAGFGLFELCDSPVAIYSMKEEVIDSGHQACWIQYGLFTPPWQQWADKATPLDNLIRAAAGDLAAKGVTYPQDFVTVHFYRAETWGALEANYMFSPEPEHIQSSVALTPRDSDWFVGNLNRYPDKVAFVMKLRAWGAEQWPVFKKSFDDGRQGP